MQEPPESGRRGRPRKQPLRRSGAELQALLRYLSWDLAKNAEIADVYRKIESERVRTGDRRLGTYGKVQTFREHWRVALEGNILPQWQLLIQPWAFAYGGEDGLAEADRLFRLIGAAEARAQDEYGTPNADPLTGSEELDGYLAQIGDTLSAVARSGEPLFVAAVLPQMREVARTIRPWRDGVVEATDSNYELLQAQIYRRASDIKATCAPEFLPRWEQPIGFQLTEAHKVSGARTVRVFIFDSLADALDARAQRVMFAQVLARTEVYVFHRAGSPSVVPPPTRMWDFAVIDQGAVVSGTYFRGTDEIGANIFFGNHDAAADYSEFFERLRLHSTEYGRFMSTHGAGQHLPAVLRDLAALLSAYDEVARARKVLAHVTALDPVGGEDLTRRTDALRELAALCAPDQDGLPAGLLKSTEDAPSAASTYRYLHRQMQLATEAELARPAS